MSRPHDKSNTKGAAILASGYIIAAVIGAGALVALHQSEVTVEQLDRAHAEGYSEGFEAGFLEGSANSGVMLEEEFNRGFQAGLDSVGDSAIDAEPSEDEPSEDEPPRGELPEGEPLEGDEREIETDTGAVSLFSYEPLNWNNWHPNTGALEDSLGYTYAPTTPFIVVSAAPATHFHLGSNAEFYLDSRYTTLRGRIAPHRDMWSNYSTRMNVFSGEVLIYSTEDICQRTRVFDFEVDISGVDFLWLRFEQREGISRTGGDLLLMDVVFE